MRKPSNKNEHSGGAKLVRTRTLRAVRIDDLDWEALARRAEQEDLTASHMVRRAVKKFLSIGP